MQKIVAGVQTDVTFANKQANLDRMFGWLECDALKSADLVVFPECMLSGYCFRSKEESLPVAESIPGPATDTIAAWCKANQKYVAFGMVEVANDVIYNACPIVGPDGLIGNYRKIHLPYLGVDRFVATGPDAYRVYDVGGMMVGPHICYDGSFPESSRTMALLGADLLILPTNWPPGAQTFAKYLPNARALENNVYFMSVNRVGVERGFRFIGESKLCQVDGESISECPGTAEGVVIGTIDTAIARQKRLVRVPGEHIIDRFADRRPEYYSTITAPHHLPRPIDDVGL
jgi:5-aminopentanamidase